MGSFRTADARAHDRAVLTSHDRPDDVDEFDARGRPNWLAAGESISYWSYLPHGAARRIASAATDALVDAKGAVIGTYDVGKAALAKLIEGIVDWVVFDESGAPVVWDPWQAYALLDGLPVDVVRVLSDRIDRHEPTSPAPPAPADLALVDD